MPLQSLKAVYTDASELGLVKVKKGKESGKKVEEARTVAVIFLPAVAPGGRGARSVHGWSMVFVRTGQKAQLFFEPWTAEPICRRQTRFYAKQHHTGQR